MKQAKKIETTTTTSVKKDKGPILGQIKGRITNELVLGFCGPMGSGTSKTANEVKEILEEYGYEVETIKVSDFLKEYFIKFKSEIEPFIIFNDIDLKKSLSRMRKGHQYDVLQSIGNYLRKEKGNDFLAQLAVKEIAIHRRASEKVKGITDIKPRKRRHATLIDSLKNPSEIELLKAVYGNMFYLFGVLCPESIRENRLIKKKKIYPHEAIALINRDKSEKDKFGQHILNTIFHSDFFIRNVDINITTLKPRLKKYVDLILGKRDITPTIHEFAMYVAESSACRSSCLSRQVGAAIINENNDLISTGFNDTPKFGGGHYISESDDARNDNRCINLEDGDCANQRIKNEINVDIKKIMMDNLGEHIDPKKIEDAWEEIS